MTAMGRKLVNKLAWGSGLTVVAIALMAGVLSTGIVIAPVMLIGSAITAGSVF